MATHKNKKKDDDKKSHNGIYIISIIILIIIIIILLLMRSCSVPGISPRFKNDIEMADDSDWDGKMKNSQGDGSLQDSISIPGYGNLQISESSQNVRLVNPSENTVYLDYKLSENGEEIFDSKAIAPGKMVECNLYDLLTQGSHTVTFAINTYDIDTHEACNGSTQDVSVTVR